MQIGLNFLQQTRLWFHRLFSGCRKTTEVDKLNDQSCVPAIMGNKRKDPEPSREISGKIQSKGCSFYEIDGTFL
ncbi:hypothetical protein J6590_053191 [Homalodisca vitripennis]|nr:hypothetical protein J6590_053191 [Homalodisca vitripennis]